MDANEKGVKSVGQTLFHCMGKWRENIGQIIQATRKKETFGYMRCKSIRTAIKLQCMGFRRGDMISTCSHNHENSCIPELASFLIGAIPSTFDPNLPILDTISLLKLIRPKIIFISPECINFMETCISKADVEPKIVVFGKHNKYTSFDEFLEPSQLEESFSPVEIEDDRETAVILFSSGTTGNPKGICLNHYTLLNPYYFEGIDEILSGSQSVILVYSTLYWISGIIYLFKSIVSGAGRILCSEFDPTLFWTIVKEHKVEFAFLAEHQAIECLKCKPPKVDTSSLRLLDTGSSRVTKEFMNDLFDAFPNTIVLNTYGMTEIGGLISKFDPTKPEELEMQRKKPQSVGKVQHYIKWKVVDPESGKVLGTKERGELLIKTDLLMNGYYKLDASDQYDEEGYMRTGDIVYFDEDNCLFIEDRLKVMFKYRGWHVLPSVVEEVVLRHPAVKEAVVLGIPNAEDGHHPMALVILNYKYSQEVTSVEILEFVNNLVSDAHKLRAGLKILTGDLPRTATGKLKREAIKALVLSGSI